MFKKLSLIVIFFLLVFSPLTQAADISPSPDMSPQPAAISSYELFWPITAGRLPGDSLYFLKQLKEQLGELLTFSNVRKSDYHLMLSKKRLVEAEKLLLDKKDYRRANTAISKTIAELQKSVDLAKKAEDGGKSAQDLYRTIARDGKTEAEFITNLVKQLPQQEQPAFSDLASKIKELANGINDK